MDLKNKIVSVIGGSNMDIVGSPKYKLIKNDSNIGTVKLSSGGVGRNIAENCALLGLTTRLFSVVGQDRFGDQLIEDTSLSGVDMSYVDIVDAPTGVYLAILDEDKDMDTAINSMEIMSYLNENYLKKHRDVLNDSSVIFLDANVSIDVLKYIKENFNSKKLFLDTVSTVKTKLISDYIGMFHTIKPNKIEAETLTGVRIENEDDLKRAANLLHGKGVKNICITLGREGVFYSSDIGLSGILKSSEFVPVNATGAGDAFQAGLVYGELSEMNLRDSAKFAMGAAIMAMSSLDTINKDINVENIKNYIIRLEEY